MEQPYDGLFLEYDFQNYWYIENGALRKIRPSSYCRKNIYRRTEEFLTSRKQQCTCKMSFSKKLAAHKKFLDQYIRQKQKKEVEKKPELFGNVTEEQYRKQMVPMNYKWIFSPEEKMDPEVLKKAVYAWMNRLEKKVNHPLVWVAAIHEDTAHPHAHILINGKDKNGMGFRISPSIVKQGAREQAQELLTNVLGPRSDELIQAANDRRITSPRFTELDNFISQHTKKIRDHERYGYSIPMMSDKKCQKRLEFLKDIGLARFHKGKYLLEHEWTDTLKTLGRYNTYLDARRYLDKKNNFKLRLYTAETGPIKGTIIFCYRMDDEAVWNNAYVIQGDDGRGYYVPVFDPPNLNLREKYVSLSLETNQKGKLSPKITVLTPPSKTPELDRAIDQKKPIKEIIQEYEKAFGR